MKIDPSLQFVLGRECPDCANDPDQTHIHSYLHEGEDGEKNKSLMVFNSYPEATRYAEEMFPEEMDDIIIMPLSEANFPDEGKHGNH
jgi:hypothetical protein|tara:strand:- start:463 stop:723 length:261 start_codon:yes stop_codon:yes gene_type:complete